MRNKSLRPLKILSIDFDFFQNVKKETLYTYPDGHDLGTDMSVFVWAHHYANPFECKLLEEVSVNQKLFDEMKEIIISNKSDDVDKPTMVANSHMHIYDFIVNNYDSKKHNGIDIVNIDMHHDMFNDNPKLDCGNWINHITERFPNYQLTWIANPISEEMYGFGEKIKHYVKTDFDSIKDKQFDIIFLCRSDTWLPPHLDNKFDELYHCIIKNYYNVLVDKQIVKPREYKEAAEAQRKAFEEFEAFRKAQKEAKKETKDE